MSVSNYIPLNIDIATINTSNVSKNVFLPATSSIYGKTISIKDITGFASLNNIIIRSQGVDRFQDSTSNYIINKNFGVASFFAKSNVWYLMNDSSQVNSNLVVNSVTAAYYYGDGSELSNTGFGLSSLSSIIAYGLSSIYSPTGVSSLSSIVAYGLSSVAGGAGISSLSSIVAYGLSSVNAGQGVSSLSSIIAYGLSSVNGGEGISSLSSIVAYGLSTVAGGEGISSLSSIVAYGLSTVALQPSPGVSSLSSIVAYGLSTLSQQPAPGVSSLSSIVAYGLSTVAGGAGISSLSSIVAYGLSSVNGGRGISSLSSIIAYGLSSVNGGRGISSLSSIVAYGLSTVALQPSPGVSSLSSIVAYGLSSINAGLGVSSLSSIVAYGLSTVASQPGTGVSSLSSIVAYGLSTVASQSTPGVSSLSSIVAYGLSTVALQPTPGVSSLSSIIAYGLSCIKDYVKPFVDSGGTQSNFVGTNTWVAGFYPSSIGGADIKDVSTGNPDTTTDALAKLDAWIYKNIVDQPAAPLYYGKSNSISTINYYWTNPQQFKVGILNIFSPYISSLHMNLYSNTVVKQELFSTFTYSDPYIPNSGFTVEGVEFASTSSNSDILTFQSPLFANKNTIRIPIDSKDFNNNNGPYSLELYFRNYSSNAFKILNFGSNDIKDIGNPDAPKNIFFRNISISNAFIELEKPDIHSLDPEIYDYPGLEYYQITLCNIDPASRRYTDTEVFTPRAIFENSNYPYETPLQSNSLGNILTPDSTYIAIVQVKNVVNPNYGPSLISRLFQTLLPDAPGTLTNITPLSNGFSNTRSVFGNISNVVVYNRNTFGVSGGGLQFITNSNLGIHSLINPGSSNKIIASISLIVTGPTGIRDSNTLDLNGYPILDATTSNSNVNTIVTAQNIRDFHSNITIQSNFFMSFTGNVMLKQSYLTAAVNPYTFSIIHSNSGFNNTTVNYNVSNYIDDLATVAPSLTSISNTTNSQSNWVSGVPAYSYSTYLAFNNDLSNLARYFYINNQNLLVGKLRFDNVDLTGTSFTCNIGTTIHTTGDVVQNIAPLPIISRIKTETTLPGRQTIFTAANNTGLRIQASLTFSNFFGSATPTSNLPFYIDGPSEHLLKTIINSVTSPTGIRVESDGGSNNVLTANTYLNTELILGNTGGTANYNFELPLVGGLFRTGGALSNLYNSFAGFQVPTGIPVGAYTNLVNYQSISAESGIRFATFRFNFENDTGIIINNFTLNISNQSGLILTNSKYNSLAVPYFYYRVNGVPGYNTGWLDANNFRPNTNSFTSGISNIGGIREDTSITINSRSLSIVPMPTGCNYSIYVKIGLRMNCNISFQNFSVIPNTKPLPPVPANVALAVSGITDYQYMSLTWNTPTACNPPLVRYNFSIIPGVANINGVEYPRRFGRSFIQEPYFFNIDCNLPTPLIQTSFSFSNLALNYDTPYYGRVALANDSGLGPYFDTQYIRTNLPRNYGVDFAGTLRPSGTPAVNYDYGGIIFANRSFGPIANTLIYNANLLFTSGSSRAFITNTNITVNTSIGNLSPIIWNVQLSSNGNLPIKNIEYEFSNALFGPSQTITAYNDTTINWTLYNVRDMYVGDTYRSNFYALATPEIKLSNTLIPVGSNRYRLSITDYILPVTNSNEFYVDNLVGSPSGRLDVENTGGISFCNICGVSVITSTTFNFWITTTNIASNFFYNPPVTASIGNMSPAFTFDSGSTPFYWNSNTGSTYTRAPISNTTYFYWQNVQVTNSNFRSSYSITGTVNNILNIGASLGGSFTPYFDFESIPLMALPRVYSGADASEYPASGTFDGTYDHNRNLITEYPYELQLSKGAFRSPGTGTLTNCYLNYTGTYFTPNGGISSPNYLGFNTNTFRFVTFKYPINTTNTSNKVDLLSLTIQWADATPTLFGNSYDTSAFKFRIRFNSNSPTQSNDSSEWLPVLSNISPRRNITTKSNQDNTGVASSVVNLVTGLNPTYTIAVPDGCGYGNFVVYARMGLTTSYNTGFSLSNILVTSLSEINIPSQFNYTCNTATPTTTIGFTTPYGLPSNTYYRLSNSLYKDNGPVPVQTTNTLMSPLSNSYTIASASVGGSYSNNTNIYSASGSLFWSSNYRFSIVNVVVPQPQINSLGILTYSGGSTYGLRARLTTFPNPADTNTNIRTYYFWTGESTNSGPGLFSNDYVDKYYSDFTQKTITAFNSNSTTNTKSINVTSDITVTYRDPDIQTVITPLFGKISFSAVDANGQFSVSCSLNQRDANASTNYTWVPGGAGTAGTGTSSVGLPSRGDASGTTFSLSGYNFRSGYNDSGSTSATHSTIYKITGSIPAGGSRTLPNDAGNLGFGVVLTTNASFFNITNLPNGSILIAPTEDNNNIGCSYINYYYI